MTKIPQRLLQSGIATHKIEHLTPQAYLAVTQVCSQFEARGLGYLQPYLNYKERLNKG